MTEDKTKPKINSRLEWRNKKILVTGGSSFIGSHLAELCAAQGYAVFYANPRGSKGYGQAWSAGLQGRWGEAQPLLAHRGY